MVFLEFLVQYETRSILCGDYISLVAIPPIVPTATGFSLPFSRPFPNLHTMMSREVKWETPFL